MGLGVAVGTGVEGGPPTTPGVLGTRLMPIRATATTAAAATATRNRVFISASPRAPMTDGSARCCRVVSAASKLARGAPDKPGPGDVLEAPRRYWASVTRGALMPRPPSPSRARCGRRAAATRRSRAGYRRSSRFHNWPLFDVMEDKADAVLRTQTVERAPDRVVVDHLVHLRSGVDVLPRFGLRAFLARVGRLDRHFAEPDAMPTCHQCGVGHDPIEPAVECRCVAETGQAVATRRRARPGSRRPRRRGWT